MKFLNTARRFGARVAGSRYRLLAAGTVALAPVASFAADATGTGAGGNGAQQAFAALSSQATSMESLAYPVMITVTGGILGIGLARKFLHKSAG